MDSDDSRHQGVMIYECLVISGHFVMFIDVFLMNGSIDFDQNHSKCET